MHSNSKCVKNLCLVTCSEAHIDCSCGLSVGVLLLVCSPALLGARVPSPIPSGRSQGMKWSDCAGLTFKHPSSVQKLFPCSN